VAAFDPELSSVRSKRLAVLSYPAFRMFWTATMVSAIGNALIPVTLALAVLRYGGGPLQLGTVLALGAITQVALLLVGGVWSDRLPRKTVIIAASATGAVLYGGMGLLLFSGRVRFWQFVVLSVSNALVNAFLRPATSGLVAQTVPKTSLQSANALLSLSNNVPMVVGPAIAGILAAVGGPGWAFVLDAASFVGAIALMARIPVVATEGAPPDRRSFWRDLTGGGREVVSTPWLWRNLVTHSLWNLGFSTLFVVGPTIMIEHSDTSDWAIVSTGIALGSVGGALISLRIRTNRPLVTGNLALLTGALPFVALLAKAPALVVAVCAVAATAGTDVLGALWNATLQRLVPTDRLSRVSSYDWMVSLSATPVGYAVAGLLLRSAGRTTALICPIALIIVPSALVTLTRSVRSVTGPESPRQPAAVAAQIADTACPEP
jgi:MFS family permease